MNRNITPDNWEYLKNLKNKIADMITAVQADKDRMTARKQALSDSKTKIAGILDGTITGDDAANALSEILQAIR